MTPLAHLEGWPIRVGGEEHRGWLPAGAARPLPTPIRELTINLLIETEDKGVILSFQSTDASYVGDTWHGSLDDALCAAETYFAIPPGRWRFSADATPDGQSEPHPPEHSISRTGG